MPILGRFSGVYVYDGSVVGLPEALREEWPGLGGNGPAVGAAALKIGVRLELLGGELYGPVLGWRRAVGCSSTARSPAPPSNSWPLLPTTPERRLPLLLKLLRMRVKASTLYRGTTMLIFVGIFVGSRHG